MWTADLNQHFHRIFLQGCDRMSLGNFGLNKVKNMSLYCVAFNMLIFAVNLKEEGSIKKS